MIFAKTQVAMLNINELLSSTPLLSAVLAAIIIIVALVTRLFLKKHYNRVLERLQETNRSLEIAVADMEAQEAQMKAEIDDLRKAEAILILRNGHLENKMKSETSIPLQGTES